MSCLSEYKTFEEKKEFIFQGEDRFIGDVETVFDVLDRQQKGQFIYRGCSEAKYKLFNSAQRFYITRELDKQVINDNVVKHYRRFIDSLIQECKQWNEGTVGKVLVKNGISDNDALAYLSYMQHYGIPSPLLDFTENPYKALFFAIDNVKYIPSDIEIDNYFSLYVCYSSADIFKHIRETFAKLTSSFKEEGIPYNELSKTLIHLVSSKDKAYKIVNNTNIINQEGLFFYNSHPFYPLEEVYKDLPDGVMKDGKETFLKQNNSSFASCYNIHKSLIPRIKEKLSKQGITKELLFPDIYKMQETIVDKATLNILMNKKDILFKNTEE